MKINSIKATGFNQVQFLTEEDDTLDQLGANEVLIKNRVSHVSAGTELACLDGLEDWFKFPSTLGYTSIGEIIKKDERIKHLNIGDLVYSFGAHASAFKIDMTDRWHGICENVPENINLHHAAFTHMAGIAITALRKSKIELGDWVAISGMGTIGNLCAQLCQLQGANVIGIDIIESRLSIAKSCGIHTLLNSKTDDIESRVREITNEKMVSTFVDATGVPSVIENASRMIARYGELILLGSPRSEYQTNLTNFLKPIHLWSHGAINVAGALEFTLPTHEEEFNKHSIARNSRIILDLIAQNRLNIAPLLSKICKPEEASEVYPAMKKSPESNLGIVFEWIN